MHIQHEDPAPARRRWPRLEVVEMVQATLGSDAAVSVVNVSEGGLLAVGPRSFSVGELHEFRFRTATTEPSPQAWVFQARVAHCRPAREGAADAHAVGLEFAPPRTEQQQEAITRFLRLCEEHSVRS